MTDTINQWDAASRQLTTAIHMYFDDGDSVSIHTLACSAREIYEKECARTGVDHLFAHIRDSNDGPDNRLWNIINGARNFFKHPRASLDEEIHFTDADNKAALFIACHDCSMLLKEAQPTEVQVFNVWFMATDFPDEVNGADQEEAADRIGQIDAMFPGLRASSAAEQKIRGRRLLLEATLHRGNEQWALSDRIGQSESLTLWLDQKLNEFAVPASDRTRLAAGCLDTAMEHHEAIINLIVCRLYGSALTLLRPTFEAYLRGAWLHQCADERELELFKRDKLELKLVTLIEALEKKPSFACGTLLRAKKAGWSKMCDFTHTGIQQAIRRNKSDSIEPAYDQAELIEALGFADAMSAMCAIEIANIASNDRLAIEVLERIKSDFLPG
jgi:sarcosine oxidase delta subunit